MINILVSDIAICQNLAVSLLNLSDFSLRLKNLALFVSQLLCLFPLEFPVLFLLMTVEEGLNLKQVTMELKLFRTHVEVIFLEALPLFIGFFALFFNIMYFICQVTLILAMAIIFLKLDLMVMTVRSLIFDIIVVLSVLVRSLNMGPVCIIVIWIFVVALVGEFVLFVR